MEKDKLLNKYVFKFVLFFLVFDRAVSTFPNFLTTIIVFTSGSGSKIDRMF